MASSTQTGRCRVLLVTVESAKISGRHGEKNSYVALYTNPDVKLRTKLNSMDSKIRWDEKFVFSISEHLDVMQPSSSLYFEIYKKRKFWKDSWVGTAICNVNSLFLNFSSEPSTQEDDESSYFSCDEGTSHDEIDFDHDSGDHVKKGKSFEQNHQHRHQGQELKASVRLEVFKGLKRKGVLDVELEKQGYIDSPGKCEWRNMAMPYEAFMGNQVGSFAKRKNLLFSCSLYS